MACKNCKVLRDAIIHGRMAEAAGITLEALHIRMGHASESDVDALPATGSMRKAELRSTAKGEGATVDDDATNDEMREAIDEHREAASE